MFFFFFEQPQNVLKCKGPKCKNDWRSIEPRGRDGWRQVVADFQSIRWRCPNFGWITLLVYFFF